MKKLIMFFVLFVITSGMSISQTWVQTGAIPDGAGVTDIIITPQGTLLVTTASWSSISGTLGGVRRSTDEGNNWDNVLEGYNGRTLYLGENGVVFASFWPYPMDEAIYRSTNDGLNWMRLHSINSGDNIFSITSKDNNNIIFIGTRNGVKRSTNAGVNWSYVNNGIPSNSWVRDIDVDTSSGIVLAATTNGVFSTTNNGANWEIATGIDPQDTIVKIKFDYSPQQQDNSIDEPVVFIGSDDASVYLASEDTRYLFYTLLTIFKEPRDEISGIDTYFLQQENYKWYGVTQFPEGGNLNQNGGFHLSRDGKTFETNNLGLSAQTRPSALTVNGTTMRGETTEINFFMGSFENAVDGAKVYILTYLVGIQQISSEIPTGFKLSQNYPNPFNPSTSINYFVPKESFVSIKVFDFLGREVTTLVSESKSTGSYDINFDASKLPSGTYFYVMTANNYSNTKKMVLMK